jgi:hypothetical protein
MVKIDRKLKNCLIQQLSESRPLSAEILEFIENPKYSSGKEIKEGDIPIHFLRVYFENHPIDLNKKLIDVRKAFKNKKISKLEMVLLEQSEIDFYSKEYTFVQKDKKIIKAVKN